MFGVTKKIEAVNAAVTGHNTQIAELTQSVENLKSNNTILEDEVLLLHNKIVSLETHLNDYLEYKKKKEEDVPFIEVISESFDEEAGMQIKLDWNDAMINYLKRNGYRGITDDEIIEKYVSDVFNDRAKNGPEQIT